MSYQAQWFRAFGMCCRSGCKKPAQGILMSFENAEMGSYCKSCADIEIADGRRQRRTERMKEVQLPHIGERKGNDQ